MRKPFYEVFKLNSNGSFSPRGMIRVPGVVLSGAVSFSRKKALIGSGEDLIDMAKLFEKDLEVETIGEIEFIQGYYNIGSV